VLDLTLLKLNPDSGPGNFKRIGIVHVIPEFVFCDCGVSLFVPEGWDGVDDCIRKNSHRANDGKIGSIVNIGRQPEL
jgi:hypothetical protein